MFNSAVSAGTKDE